MGPQAATSTEQSVRGIGMNITTDLDHAGEETTSATVVPAGCAESPLIFRRESAIAVLLESGAISQ